VLVGLPELEDRLASRRNRSLIQRDILLVFFVWIC